MKKIKKLVSEWNFFTLCWPYISTIVSKENNTCQCQTLELYLDYKIKYKRVLKNGVNIKLKYVFMWDNWFKALKSD